MSCSCKSGVKEQVVYSTDNSGAPVVEYVPAAAIPHEVLPGESCIFCTGKHLYMAYTLIQTESAIAAVIGELELARRHTLVEYKEISTAIARLLYAACTRDIATVIKDLPDVMAVVEVEAEKHDPNADAGTSEKTVYTMRSMTPEEYTDNPLLAELHACAAWRLAIEVGYYMNNRRMIVGDLALTSQHAYMMPVEFSDGARDLRHRLQTYREADTDIAWPAYIGSISAYADDIIEKSADAYTGGLRSYLGLATSSQEQQSSPSESQAEASTHDPSTSA